MVSEQLNPAIEKILINIEKVIIGKRDIAELCLVALLAEGHVLLENVPGVGKTMMVRALATSLNANFHQFDKGLVNSLLAFGYSSIYFRHCWLPDYPKDNQQFSSIC